MSLDAGTSSGLHTFCDHIPDIGSRIMDPVIVVGAGPVGLSLALALAGSGVRCVVLDEGPGKDLPRPARTVVLHADTAAMAQRLGCTTLRDEGAYYAAWRTMRRGRDTGRTTFDDGSAPCTCRSTPSPAGCATPRERTPWSSWSPTANWTPSNRTTAGSPHTPGAPRRPGGAGVTWSAATEPAPPCANCSASASRAAPPSNGMPWPRCAPNSPGPARPCCTATRRRRPPPDRCPTGCGGWTGCFRPAAIWSPPTLW